MRMSYGKQSHRRGPKKQTCSNKKVEPGGNNGTGGIKKGEALEPPKGGLIKDGSKKTKKQKTCGENLRRKRSPLKKSLQRAMLWEAPLGVL